MPVKYQKCCSKSSQSVPTSHRFLVRRKILPALISALVLGAADVGADTRLWMNGAEYVPNLPSNLPVPNVGQNGENWLEFGELTDRSGNIPVTSAEQFAELLEGTNKNVLRITQQSDRLILNWDSFDIAEGYRVNFDQPSEVALALNKINESASPSHIMGSLEANGGVYLINPNGIIFGENSRVNIGSLLATTLNIDEEIFLNGTFADTFTENVAAFYLDDLDEQTEGMQLGAEGDVFKLDDEGNLTLVSASEIAAQQGEGQRFSLRGDIALLPGAEVRSSTLNGVVAVAPNVINHGSIESPDGQTILAAAVDEAHVIFSDDPSLRGLLIEVNTGGKVSNLGSIIAERGNVTLAGIAVNQEGTVRATTSVDANGTIRLLARDTLSTEAEKDKSWSFGDSISQVSALLDPEVTQLDNVNANSNEHFVRISKQGGELTLKENSVTEVVADESGGSAPNVQAQLRSGIELSAARITLESHSLLSAKGGDVFLEANTNLLEAYSAETGREFLYRYDLEQERESQPRIVIDSNAQIDVSGYELTQPMSRNILEVELRGNELADSPLQRNGYLHGQTVYVDAREGTPLTDISVAIDNLPRTIEERLADAGSIRLRSEGEVIVQAGVDINISGGAVHYDGGYLNTTQLIHERRIIDISQADPSYTYTGIFGKETITNERFNITHSAQNFFIGGSGEYQDPYTYGASAGELVVDAQAAFLQGNIEASTQLGLWQRNPSATDFPELSRLDLTVNLQAIELSVLEQDSFNLSLSLLEEGFYAAEDEDQAEVKSALPLIISEELLERGELAHISLRSSNSSITLSENVELQLADGGSLSLSAAEKVDFYGLLTIIGGDVTIETSDFSFNNAFFNGFTLPVESRESLNHPINFGSSASIDTSGSWVNDNPLIYGYIEAPDKTAFIDAGDISFYAAGDLLLSLGSRITANGGGWMDSGLSLHPGRGGSISLTAKRSEEAGSAFNEAFAEFDLNARLSSYGFYEGGALSISAPNIEITNLDKVVEKGWLNLDSSFFIRGGFSQYNLTALSTNIVSPSQLLYSGPLDIAPQMENYAFISGANETISELSLLTSGSNLASEFGTSVLPNYLRKPVGLTFRLEAPEKVSPFVQDTYSALRVGSDVSFEYVAGQSRNQSTCSALGLECNLGADIQFYASSSIIFDGQIVAPAAEIRFEVNNRNSAKVDGEHYYNTDDVGIAFGGNSLIDVSSALLYAPPSIDPRLQEGEVYNAGSIDILTNQGFVIAETGASFDLSAEQYELTVLEKTGSENFTPTPLIDAADAGSFRLKAAEGILFDGSVAANAPLEHGASGGRLEVSLDTSSRFRPDPGNASSYDESGTRPQDNYRYSTISFAERNIILEQSIEEDLVPDELDIQRIGFENAIDDSLNGEARIDLDEFMESGFDSMTFHTGFVEQDLVFKTAMQGEGVDFDATSGIGRIVFAGDISLLAGDEIVLDATTLVTEGYATLLAPLIRVGYQGIEGVDPTKHEKVIIPDLASGGEGSINIIGSGLSIFETADLTRSELASSLNTDGTEKMLATISHENADGLIDLRGFVSTRGADSVVLGSAGDIRVNSLLTRSKSALGAGDNARLLGAFTVAEDITLQADQIYPTTLSEYLFLSSDSQLLSDDLITLNTKNIYTSNLLSFDTEYFDSDKGELVKETGEAASLLEFYDFLSDDLAAGGLVQRNRKVGTETNALVDLEVKDYQLNYTTNGDISILSNGDSTPVMSVGGELIFVASNIEQGGAIKAPLGELTFIAGGGSSSGVSDGTVTFTAQSVTSTSLENQTLVFGELDATGSLVYSVNEGVGVRLYEEAPKGEVLIQAKDSDIQSGATVNLSGGGDLLSWQFVPGPGGSKDILSLANYEGSFAILPGSGISYAPVDRNIENEAGGTFEYALGTSVYLDGFGDLPAGQYTVLPPRYALLPGAYLISPSNDGQLIQLGDRLRRVDGVPVVAGRFVEQNTGNYDSRYQGFVVETGGLDLLEKYSPEGVYDASLASLVSVPRLKSEFSIDFASKLYTNGTSSPYDAGALKIEVSESLALDGTFLTSGYDEGRGAALDIAAESLVVSQTPHSEAGDTVFINANQIIDSNFESVLLGGIRKTGSDGENDIYAVANSLIVDKDAHLRTDELILVTKGDESNVGLLTISKGGLLESDGEQNSTGGVYNVYADSLVAISSDSQVEFVISPEFNSNLELEQGSELKANNAATVLFTSGDSTIDNSFNLSGGSLELSVKEINLGNIDDKSLASLEGLALDAAKLSTLLVDKLSLSSRSTINFFGDYTLQYQDLNLQAAGYLGYGLEGEQLRIATDNVFRISGGGEFGEVPLAEGTGSIEFSADKLVFADGNSQFSGFDAISFTAKSVVVGKGVSNIDVVGRELSIAAPVLVGEGAARTNISTDGMMRISANGEVPDDEVTAGLLTSLGASLILSSDSLHYDATAVYRSGQIQLHSENDLSLTDNAILDVSGYAKNFGGEVIASDAGSITLVSATGDLIMSEGSLLNLSGVDIDNVSSEAGQLVLSALSGDIDFSGSILAESTGGLGASLSLAIGKLDDLTSVLSFAREGNFSNVLQVTTNEGSLELPVDQQVNVHEFSLTANSGEINIQGDIKTTGEGGVIRLNAWDNLFIRNSASLDASSTSGDGGSITLSTRVGAIEFEDGASLAARGGDQAGSILLRAPRVNKDKSIITEDSDEAGVDVNIWFQQDSSLADVLGEDNSEVVVEAVKTYRVESNTSEVFQTSPEGEITITFSTKLLPHKNSAPDGAICNESDGCDVLYSDNTIETIEFGIGIPSYAIAYESNGIEYRIADSNYQQSIAYIDTHNFMNNASSLEQRLFGTEVGVHKADCADTNACISDNFHLRPGIEITSKNDLFVDEKIDFGEGLGFSLAGEGSSASNADDLTTSLWRFNEKRIVEEAPSIYTFAEFSRFTGGETGILTLRSEKSIHINATVSDAFAQQYSRVHTQETTLNSRDELLDEPNGWSYNLIAGADLESADINSYSSNEAYELYLSNGVVVRSGVGDINARSSGDIVFNSNAVIYSAGRDTGKGFFDEFDKGSPDNNMFEKYYISDFYYPESGGDIVIVSGGDIVGSNSQQYFNNWLQAIGGGVVGDIQIDPNSFPSSIFNGYVPVTWAVVPDKFRQDVAALGGGNVSVVSGGNISGFSASIPSTGKNTLTWDLERDGVLTPIGKALVTPRTTEEDILVLGGGDLLIESVGDISTSKFYVGDGSADVRSGGFITAGNEGANVFALMDGDITISSAGDLEISSVFNPTAYVTSLDRVGYIAENPSMSFGTRSLSDNSSFFYTYSDKSSLSLTSLSGDILFNQNYSPENVLLQNDGAFLSYTGIGNVAGIANLTEVLPPSLEVAALQGDVVFSNPLTIFPSARGGMSIIADGSIRSDKPITDVSGAILNVVDVQATELPSMSDPLWDFIGEGLLPITDHLDPFEKVPGQEKKNENNKTRDIHSETPLYINNPDPTVLVADTGDVENIRLISPTKGVVKSGRDIKNVILEFQNLREDDVSVVEAGGNIEFDLKRSAATNLLDSGKSYEGIEVKGVGRLDVMAGGDINLGSSAGIVSSGAQNNPKLRKSIGLKDERGADISLMAGVTGSPAYESFKDIYFSEYEAIPGYSDTTDLVNSLKKYDFKNDPELGEFLDILSSKTLKDYDKLYKDVSERKTKAFEDYARLPWYRQQAVAFEFYSPRKNSYSAHLIEYVTSERFGLSEHERESLKEHSIEQQFSLAVELFESAPEFVQRDFIFDVYFAEVQKGGIENATDDIEDIENDGFPRSYQALQALFPGTEILESDTLSEDVKAYDGNINMVFSTIQTQQGGDIRLIVPGGDVDVGVAVVGGSGIAKESSELGLIALRKGDVLGTTSGDVNVNSSRVFALDGGDIMLWSSVGNIDAGRGAKSALTVPPPQINEDGSQNFQAAVSGSGIRNSRFTSDRSPGAVYLFAPVGVVDAGDAGIGSQGDVLVAAQEVIGADNIDVGGVSIGIPVNTGITSSVAQSSSAGTSESDRVVGDLEEAFSSEGCKPGDQDDSCVAFVTVDVIGFDF